MAGFGGSVKLTGEAEYRNALKMCTQSLREMASAQQASAAQFSASDKSTSALTTRQEQLNAILAKQKSVLADVTASYNNFASKVQEQAEKHKALQDQYNKEVAELERIKAESGETSAAYKTQSDKVADLAAQLKKSEDAYNQNEMALSKMRTQMNNTQATVDKTAKEIDDLGKETEDAGESAKKASDGFTVMKGVLANLASSAIKSALNGLKSLGNALVDVGKQSIASYADYEQLVGGVETLFKDSAKVVQEYAANAYKTAGMSANQYMETVTSFSASLLQGLNGDTAKAAKVADMAISDMADNANKMGTSIEMIQNAYSGFARGTYVMLDNLKLGYAGSAGEMARLINESGVLNGAMKVTAETVKNVPFDKMIEAIHKVQQQMGITGTTSKEAASTISGSVSSMKAAWKNLLTAIADDNADLSKSVDEFISSAITAGKNIVPRVRQIVDGIKKLINNLVSDVFPKLKKEIPELAPLIEPFEWLIKNYKIVVNAVSAIVAAFVVTKIVNFVTSIMSTVTALGSAIKAADGFAGAIGGIGKAISANPFGLLVGALAGVVTAVIGVISTMQDATKEAAKLSDAAQAQVDAVNNAADSWDNLKESQQQAIDAGMSQISYTRSLKDELEDLVDANGKVKEGYEGRVQFILGQLNDALGTELTMTGGIVDKYKEQMSTIDQLIEKKKAQIILQSQEALYTEAINNQNAAMNRRKELQDEINARTEHQKELQDEVKQLEDQLAMSRDIYTSLQLARKQEELAAWDAETTKVQDSYNRQTELLKEYIFNIDQYESNAALAHEGRYNEMTQVNFDYAKDYKSSVDQQVATLQAQIDQTRIKLNTYNDLYKQTGDNRYKELAKSAQDELNLNKDTLSKYLQTTSNELKNNNKTWLDNTATVLSKLSDQAVEFKQVGEDQVQMYIDGHAEGEPQATAQAEATVKEVLKAYDQQVAAKGAGENVITGFTKGEGNLSLQNAAFTTARTFAGGILDNLKKKLGIASPSKETNKIGRYLVQGLGLGIDKEEDSVLKQVTDFGQSVIDAMNNGLSDGIDTSAITSLPTTTPDGIMPNMAVNAATSAANGSAYASMVSAFKDALAGVKIVLDGDEVGTFIDQTVTDLVYN